LKKNKKVQKGIQKKARKKAQLWLSDYSIALMIFILAMILSTKIIVNNFVSNTEFERLKADASKISEALMAEGYPSDWDNSTIIRLGLYTDNRLNSSKVFFAMNNTYINYQKLRGLLQTNKDFIIIFRNNTNTNITDDMIEFNNLCVIGDPSMNINKTVNDCHNPLLTSITYDDLVIIRRYVVYNAKIIPMEVYVWN